MERLSRFNKNKSMYPNPIPLNNGSATINYDYRGGTMDTSRYVGPAGSETLDLIPVLSIGHQTSNPNNIGETRRSKFRLDHPVVDEAGNRGTISFYMVLSVPTKVALPTDITAVITEMKNFLAASGFIGKMISAEI